LNPETTAALTADPSSQLAAILLTPPLASTPVGPSRALAAATAAAVARVNAGLPFSPIPPGTRLAPASPPTMTTGHGVHITSGVDAARQHHHTRPRSNSSGGGDSSNAPGNVPIAALCGRTNGIGRRQICISRMKPLGVTRGREMDSTQPNSLAQSKGSHRWMMSDMRLLWSLPIRRAVSTWTDILWPKKVAGDESNSKNDDNVLNPPIEPAPSPEGYESSLAHAFNIPSNAPPTGAGIDVDAVRPPSASIDSNNPSSLTIVTSSSSSLLGSGSSSMKLTKEQLAAAAATTTTTTMVPPDSVDADMSQLLFPPGPPPMPPMQSSGGGGSTPIVTTTTPMISPSAASVSTVTALRLKKGTPGPTASDDMMKLLSEADTVGTRIATTEDVIDDDDDDDPGSAKPTPKSMNDIVDKSQQIRSQLKPGEIVPGGLTASANSALLFTPPTRPRSASGSMIGPVVSTSDDTAVGGTHVTGFVRSLPPLPSPPSGTSSISDDGTIPPPPIVPNLTTDSTASSKSLLDMLTEAEMERHNKASRSRAERLAASAAIGAAAAAAESEESKGEVSNNLRSLWRRLYVIDFVRPQVNFQSDDTNSRLVLTAHRARVQGRGLPVIYDLIDTLQSAKESSSQSPMYHNSSKSHHQTDFLSPDTSMTSETLHHNLIFSPTGASLPHLQPPPVSPPLSAAFVDQVGSGAGPSPTLTTNNTGGSGRDSRSSLSLVDAASPVLPPLPFQPPPMLLTRSSSTAANYYSSYYQSLPSSALSSAMPSPREVPPISLPPLLFSPMGIPRTDTSSSGTRASSGATPPLSATSVSSYSSTNSSRVPTPMSRPSSANPHGSSNEPQHFLQLPQQARPTRWNRATSMAVFAADDVRTKDKQIFFVRETCATLAGAQAFVAPVDIDLASRVEWVDMRK
jgi:hypothetical protein